MTAETIHSLVCPSCGGQRFAELKGQSAQEITLQTRGGINILGREPIRLTCDYCGHQFLYTPDLPVNVQGDMIGGDSTVVSITHVASSRTDPDEARRNRFEQFNYLLRTLQEKLADPTAAVADPTRQVVNQCIRTLEEQLEAAAPNGRTIHAALTQMSDEFGKAKKWKLAGIVTSLEDQADALFLVKR